MLWTSTACSRIRSRWISALPSLNKRPARYLSHLPFRSIDEKWQRKWNEDFSKRVTGPDQKSYVLPMFAYPSGSLHMGHLRVYTISDVIARCRRMQGYKVLHPTGWDAFGLPAENAAIERGLDPAVWTRENISKMKTQLKSMNTSFDWDSEISTCDPSFYKHTQRLFLMLYRQDLAYQAEALVNWDPVDKTVLANEQVDNNGRSWRSGAVVQQVNLRQWFFRITAFKKALLKDLDYLAEKQRWPDRVLTQQRNWIGLSTGARLRVDVQHPEGTVSHHYVFTTRPDTIFGAKYLAVSLSHGLSQALKIELPDLQALIDEGDSRDKNPKAGIKLPLKARFPSVSKDFNLSVFAASYVLDGYGDGAVMGVPAHDSRDLAFWKQHCPAAEIPIVIQPPHRSGTELHVDPSELDEALTGPGTLTDLCGEYAGLTSSQAAKQIVEDLSHLGDAGKKLAEYSENWRLRDWLVSRQRYWGTPIPIIHCKHCGTVPVPESDLPVELPQLDASMKGQRGNPLEKIDSWVNVPCPSCKKPAKRETDTMDTFVDSSWYYGRFIDSENADELFSREAAEKMLPVDTYIGGVEHAILHLLYARFIYKFLCSEGLAPGHGSEAEPFRQLVAQGMVHGKTFSDPQDGRFLKVHEVDDSTSGNPIVKSTGEAANVSWEKMSKSKHNGVDPSHCIKTYGADATRAHILFAAPVSEVLQWDEEKIVGMQRWFSRVQKIISHDSMLHPSLDLTSIERLPPSYDLTDIGANNASVLLTTDATVRAVTKTFNSDAYSLNTVISDLIKLTNSIHDAGLEHLRPDVVSIAGYTLLRLLAPIAPAFAEECWESLCTRRNLARQSIFSQPWPSAMITSEQDALLRASESMMNCTVQINGRVRFTARVPKPSAEESMLKKPSEERLQSVVDAVMKTEDGRVWLTQKNDWNAKRKVFLVGAGKILSVVF